MLNGIVRSLRFGFVKFNNVQYARFSVKSDAFKVGFIGVGNMGSRMSANLIQKGHKVLLFDNDANTAERLKKEKFEVADSIEQLIDFGDCLITMLPNGNIVLDLYKGIAQKLKKGSLIIDCSTVDPKHAIELKTVLSNSNVDYVDAPVSGGVQAAGKATLTFMVGGEKQAYERARNVLLSMGTNVIHCGQQGNGQVAKICNNMLLGISMIGLSESLNLGKKMGLDPKLLLQIINISSGRCWSSDVYSPIPNTVENAPSSNDYKPGFQARIMLKDLRIAKASSDSYQVNTTLGQNAWSIYEQLCATPMGDLDFSVVIKFMENLKK